MLSMKEVPRKSPQKRNDRKSTLFMIELCGPWVFATAVLLLTTDGHLLEGRFSFILIFLAKLCGVICSVELLILLAATTERSLLRRLYLAVVIIFIFLLLRNPVLDLPYLVHPAQENLTGIYVDSDMQYTNYSTFYHLNGIPDTSNGPSYFYINGSTYKKLSEHRGTAVHVEYLPHTKHVIRISE